MARQRVRDSRDRLRKGVTSHPMTTCIAVSAAHVAGPTEYILVGTRDNGVESGHKLLKAGEAHDPYAFCVYGTREVFVREATPEDVAKYGPRPAP